MSRMFRFALLLGTIFLLCSSTALAQQVHGKFTLPFPATWGRTHLPPGEYTFRSGPVLGAFELSGENGRSFVLYTSAEDIVGSPNSKLVVVPVGTQRKVRILYLACLHKAFYFNIPVRYRVDASIIAHSDSAPPLGETIPVVTFGK